MDNQARLEKIRKELHGVRSAKDLGSKTLLEVVHGLSQKEKPAGAHEALETAQHFFQTALAHLAPSPLKRKIEHQLDRFKTFSMEEGMEVAEALEAVEHDIQEDITQVLHPTEAGVYMALAKLAGFCRWLLHAMGLEPEP
jgi:hypothetical protein